jgi:hypothetical protein
MHDTCLEPIKNQTLKNARLPNRIVNDNNLMMPVGSGKHLQITILQHGQHKKQR